MLAPTAEIDNVTITAEMQRQGQAFRPNLVARFIAVCTTCRQRRIKKWAEASGMDVETVDLNVYKQMLAW